jgi:hypothetical protein
VGRYGGEEFLLILPGNELDTAFRQAERIRTAIASEPFSAGTLSLGVTCSFRREPPLCCAPIVLGRLPLSRARCNRGGILRICESAHPAIGQSPNRAIPEQVAQLEALFGIQKILFAFERGPARLLQ